MNKVKKGNYYRLKTKEFYEGEGYSVENLERTERIYVYDKKEKKEKIIFVKRDLWGGDLIAAKKESEEVLWIQVKTNKGDIADGLKKLEKNPLPDSKVQKVVVLWEPRQREPEIIRLG